MRKKILAANWKLNLKKDESEELLKEINLIDLGEDREEIILLPSIYLYQAEKYLTNDRLYYGVQNLYYEESGAFTGEISSSQVKEFGVKYVIVGHSERRNIFLEDNAMLNNKLKAVLRQGLNPIFCIGEPIVEREKRTYEAFLYRQLKEGLDGIDIEDVDRIIFAYEPIWAIGSGRSASTGDIKTTLEFVRNTLDVMYKGIKDNVRILYGGSVKAENIHDIMNTEHVDGVLVGGASLKIEEWKKIISVEVK